MRSSQSRTPTPHSLLPTPGAAKRPRLDVFVYGSLKRGQSNHERFCRGLVAVREATVRGRLYELPFGFPALVVPEKDIYSTGTTDYLADARAPSDTQAGPQERYPGWDTVHGELMTFDDPGERTIALDLLEGYIPGEKGIYERVLIPIKVAGEAAVLAWAYRIERATGIYLPGGRWPAP